MERRPRLLVLIAAAVVGAAPGSPTAGVLLTREAGLAKVFGAGARFEPRTDYLTPAQIDSVRRRAQAPFTAARVTSWVAIERDSLLGRAYLDTRTVRTMPATLLVAVHGDGRVRAVEVLAFHEPSDYLPPARWLERFAGRWLGRRLRPGADVDAISGATLSARTFAESVRCMLALDSVLQGRSR